MEKVSMIANFQTRKPASKLAQELAKRCDGCTQAVLSWVGGLIVFDFGATLADGHAISRGALQWFACRAANDRRFWMSCCSSRDLKSTAGRFEHLLKPQGHGQIKAVEINRTVRWENEEAAGSTQRPRKRNKVHGAPRVAELYGCAAIMPVWRA